MHVDGRRNCSCLTQNVFNTFYISNFYVDETEQSNALRNVTQIIALMFLYSECRNAPVTPVSLVIYSLSDEL